MPYIGRSTDGFGVRNRFLYLASASDTSVSGADANGATLTFTDGAYVDVYLNGVLLKAGTDYNTNTANTIASLAAMAANDEVTVVVYDIFTTADMVSATSGGTFTGNVTMGGTLSVTGTSTLTGNITASGDLDVDGTTNLDVVDIDGAVDIASTTTLNDDVTFTGANYNVTWDKSANLLQFADNAVLRIGTGNDLDIYHSSNESIIKTQTDLPIKVIDAGNADIATLTPNGAVSLYHNGTAAISTASGGAVTVANGLTLSDGNVTVASGHGIDFSANTHSAVTGASMTSELFDYYEEGNWTPVPYGASTSGSVTSGTMTGRYTRIGRMVHLECRATAIVLANAAGSYYIDGLPYTVGGTGYNSGAVSFYGVDLHDYSTQVNVSGTTCYFLVTRDNTTWTTLNQTQFGSQHYYHFSIAYTV